MRKTKTKPIKHESRCLWCHQPLKSPTSYYRAIDPLIRGAFAAVCSENCPETPEGGTIVRKVGK